MKLVRSVFQEIVLSMTLLDKQSLFQGISDVNDQNSLGNTEFPSLF